MIIFDRNERFIEALVDMINCFNEFFLEEVVGGKLRGKMDRCVYCASYLGQSAIIINAVGPDNEDVCHVQVWFGYSYCGILHHYILEEYYTACE